MVVGPDGKPMVLSRPSGNSKPPGSKTPAAVAGAKGDADGEKKEDKPKGGESPEPKVIRRGDTVKGDADPEELKATVGEDGKVAFQFRNQPWVELVQWLAEISDQPLDWLELPADRVNLRSPGRYTVEQTRDLFNRYLLARGYTLLELDGGLTVAKTENINPAIVPRVEVTSLHTMAPHSYVRTLLDVGWLSAEKLSEELKPMISSNGRLTALATTNRIEAMDAVINLRQVASLLQQERDSTSREALAPEFKLRYLPAEEAKRLLEEFLGVEKKKATAMTPQQIQMMAQMRNQGQQKTATPEKKVEISIVANPRQNSVLIRAPIDRLTIAMEFLKRVDVRSNDMISLADVQSRVQVLRLESLDPEKLIEIVTEMNILEPTTRVRVDKDNDALIVSGSAADRFIINSLIERLDGTGRKFEVLQLRRLDAGEVAESIAFLMGQEEEEDNSSSRGRSYFYGYGYGNEKEEKKETDEFRVAANARYRQVLLWANPSEMEEVRSLLVKLGELPPPGGSNRTIRMIDASATPETYEYLQRLQQQWNRLSPNPLELPAADEFKDPNASPANEEKTDADSTEPAEAKEPAADPKKVKALTEDTIAMSGDHRYRLALAQTSPTPLAQTSRPGGNDSQDVDVAAEVGKEVGGPIESSRDFDRAFRRPPVTKPQQASGESPPVRIELDRNGNLVLVSPDTDALDRLEQLMLQIAPPKRPYQVFHIVHASSFWMKLNLEDYFENDEDSGASEADSFYRYYWGAGDEGTDDGPSGLGKGNKLRFVDDPDTNTLVVTGATSDQLQTIAELIELWDVPEPVNKRKTRFTRLVYLKYAQSEPISETVKEAYRDLLSSNDKSFQGGGGQGGRGGGGAKGGADVAKSRDGNGSGLEDSQSGRDAGGADFSFKGKLSMGIDKVGNTLLVSAEGEPLLELVCDMIEQLDKAAQPQGEVEVIQFSGDINAGSLQQALKALGAEPITTNSAPAGMRGRGNREPGESEK
jgi:type II secretory pathway component GspD/PulD (secretin)